MTTAFLDDAALPIHKFVLLPPHFCCLVILLTLHTLSPSVCCMGHHLCSALLSGCTLSLPMKNARRVAAKVTRSMSPPSGQATVIIPVNFPFRLQYPKKSTCSTSKLIASVQHARWMLLSACLIVCLVAFRSTAGAFSLTYFCSNRMHMALFLSTSARHFSGVQCALTLFRIIHPGALPTIAIV